MEEENMCCRGRKDEALMMEKKREGEREEEEGQVCLVCMCMHDYA